MSSRFWRGAASVVAALSFGLIAGTSNAVGPNLVTNPGFESGLTGWTTSGFFAQNFDYGIDSVAHSGTSAFYGGAIGGLGFLRQNIATVQGSEYTVGVWLLSDGFLPNEF